MDTSVSAPSVVFSPFSLRNFRFLLAGQHQLRKTYYVHARFVLRKYALSYCFITLFQVAALCLATLSVLGVRIVEIFN